MKIGMIGAGFVARGLTALAVKQGHVVMLSNSRGPRSLHSTAPMLGCQIGSVDEAIAFGYMVLLALPLYAYPDLPLAALAGKVVVDAGNYHPKRDEIIPPLEGQAIPSSLWLAEMAPGARVVKAFNAILATDLDAMVKDGPSEPLRALPLAGDDAEAVAAVAALHRELGFEPVEAGPLSESWRFETNMPSYCARLDRAALIKRLHVAERGQPWPYRHWETAPDGNANS